MGSPAGFAAGLLQRIQKQDAVVIVSEDRVPSITPVHHVVKGSGYRCAAFCPQPKQNMPATSY